MPQLAFKIAAMLPSSGLMAEAMEEFAAAGLRRDAIAASVNRRVIGTYK
jgi:hypothetical protein